MSKKKNKHEVFLREIWHRTPTKTNPYPEEIAVVTMLGEVKFFKIKERMRNLSDTEEFLMGQGFKKWVKQKQKLPRSMRYV